MASILYVVTSLSVGGAQKALLHLASSTFSAYYRPYVLTLVGEGGLQAAFIATGIPVQSLQLQRPSQWFLMIPRVLRLLWQVRPHAVHGWQHHGNLLATLIWLLAGCRPRLLWGIHHTPTAATLRRPQHALVLRLGRWLSPLPQHILYVSQRSLEQHRALGYACQRAEVVPNGIPLTGAPDPRVRQEIRTALGVSENTPLIGSLTRAVPEKDIPNLLAAIAHYQRLGDNAHFLLAGEGMVATHPLLQAGLAQVLEPARVHCLGVRSDANRLLAALDLATLASSREALPLFLLEAMAQGVPCVATAVGDVPTLVGETGWVVPPHDPVALAQAWQTMLALPLGQRQALGEKARQRVQVHYSLAALVDKYRALLPFPAVGKSA